MSRHSRSAVTLIQLLIVLAILAMLLAFLLPALQKVREAAARTQCANNLKQLAIAVHSSADLYKRLPPVAEHYPGIKKPSPIGSCNYHLLPFLELQNIYRLTMATVNVDSQETYSVKNPDYRIKIQLCPSDASLDTDLPGEANYLPNFAVFQNMAGGSRQLFQIPDGTSNTLGYAEAMGKCKETNRYWFSRMKKESWIEGAAPFQSPGEAATACSDAVYQGLHPSGINIMMLDGAVFSKNENLRTSKSWLYALDPVDGMPFGRDWTDR